MTTVPDIPVTLRAGGPLSTLDCRPLTPYAPQAIAFLSALSKALLALPQSRQYPDIAAFAYWCRAANLARQAREFDSRRLRLGRGLALHIAPANVPVNFAFSLAFGILSGNANIVRVPDTGFEQVEIICKGIESLFAEPEHARIASMNRLVSYPRSDEITTAFSRLCQARVLWGGDATVSHLRALPVHPRCVDIAFADRYSFCIMNPQAVMDADEKAMPELVHGFYNDVFLLDQNACSSPHLLVWHGDADTTEAAKARFWSAMTAHLQGRYQLAPVHAVDKFVHLCRAAIALPQIAASTRNGNLVYRAELRDLPADIEEHRGQHGFFYEYRADNLDCLLPIVGTRYQTLTCFGMDPAALAGFVVENGLTGIDRVVPVGKALDMGVVWDGYDLVADLSRIVNTA